MAAEAVGAGLDQRRRLVRASALDGAADDVANGQHIHAVDRLGRNAVDLAELPDLGLGQRPLERGPHGVSVVLADPDHRQLPERGEVHRLVELALGDRAVAEVAHADLIATLVVDGEPDAGGQGKMGADDGVAAEEVHTLVEQMHRAALTLAQAVAAAEQLGHGPAWVAALGQAVTVLAIGRDRIVITSQHRRGAGGNGFLTDGEVEESTDLAQGVRFGRFLLEAADQHHVGEQAAGQLGIDGRRTGLLRFGLLRHVSSYRPPTIASRSARPPIAAGGPGRSRR